eukprot:CAMPEP_0206245674 /NCGR_PEP_ID=MMETSP0047_2-20121206/18825_1 /ASSEMBLY_ACC=CAM_ASM_000192 /TAXON_ID=195065 /ORGANISM="Chroomonas mesostigmatica_cf, Strain CCMP1168" /LENGTH=116 /DNA_ID=CAMNT_0053670993 /DNA_START=126 /DNA_END=473 /DNA_ORIENTATION=+
MSPPDHQASCHAQPPRLSVSVRMVFCLKRLPSRCDSYRTLSSQVMSAFFRPLGLCSGGMYLEALTWVSCDTSLTGVSCDTCTSVREYPFGNAPRLRCTSALRLSAADLLISSGDGN